jgi:hypothetical protein
MINLSANGCTSATQPRVPASPAQRQVFDDLAQRLALADATLARSATPEGQDRPR